MSPVLRDKRRLRRPALVIACVIALTTPCLGAGLQRTPRSPEAEEAPAAPSAPPVEAPGRAVIAGPTTPQAAITPPSGPGVHSAPTPVVTGLAALPRTVEPPAPPPSGRAVLAPAQRPALALGEVARSEPPARLGVTTVRAVSPAPPAPAPIAPSRLQPVPAPSTQAGAPAAAGERAILAPGPAPTAPARPQGPVVPAPAVVPPARPVAGITGQGVTVTPETAAALAVRESLDLEITAADIREAEAQVVRAFGLDDFRVTATGTIGRRGPVATFALPGEEGEVRELSLGSADIRTASVQVAKPLYDAGRIDRAQEVALRALETRKLSKAVVERALDLAARQTSYGVLRAEQLLDVTRRRAVAVAAHLELTKRLMEAGVVARFEVVQAETELARAQGEVISARTAVETARAGLRRILNLPQDTSLEVVAGRTFEGPPGTLQTLIAQASEQRPEVHAGEAGIALAEANVRLARASRNVSVNLVGSLTQTEASFGAEPWGWQVAITAEKPIVDGRVGKSEVQAAQARLDGARLSLERTRQEIALDVTQAHLALDEARERLTVARQGVVEAEERLRIAQVRYQSGVGLGIEVLDAQTALAASRADVVNSHYSHQLAVARLRSALGLWSGNE